MIFLWELAPWRLLEASAGVRGHAGHRGLLRGAGPHRQGPADECERQGAALVCAQRLRPLHAGGLLSGQGQGAGASWHRALLLREWTAAAAGQHFGHDLPASPAGGGDQTLVSEDHVISYESILYTMYLIHTSVLLYTYSLTCS